MRSLSFSLFLFFLNTLTVGARVNPDATLFNQQAESKLNVNPKEAIALAGKAKTTAERNKDKKNSALATILIGVANFKIDNYDRARTLLLEALKLSENCGDSSTLAYAYYWNGNMEVNKGEYAKALEHYEIAKTISTENNDSKNLARSLDGLGSIYEVLNENEKALAHYNESLKVALEVNFKEWIPTILSSLANLALKNKNTEQAITKFKESATKSDAVGNLNNKANCLQQLASIYYDKKDTKQAMEYVQEAMKLFQQTGALVSYSRSRLQLSLILMVNRDYDQAINLAKLSLDYGNEKKDIALQRDACEVLYYGYYNKGDKGTALNYHIQLYDLSQKGEVDLLAKKLTQMELKDKFENEQKINEALRDKERAEMNAQIGQQKFVKKASFIVLGLFAIIAGLSIFAFVQKRNDTRVIASEKKKSDDLLLHILPKEVMLELKENAKSADGQYDLTTVLFADLKIISGVSDGISSQKLLEEIDFYFRKFDEIIARYKIEKIMTIGDAYLCVSSLPNADKENAVNMVNAAFEMQQFINQTCQPQILKGEPYFEIRIGINSGPLIAGIVGLRKVAYDIWGDTVNIAAHMEQYGEIKKINISSSTYELVKDTFVCKYSGKKEAKGKGYMDMYFVEGVL